MFHHHYSPHWYSQFHFLFVLYSLRKYRNLTVEEKESNATEQLTQAKNVKKSNALSTEIFEMVLKKKKKKNNFISN